MKTILLCGKAGSGKSYLLDKIFDTYYGKNELNYLRLCTTRPPRDDETDGIDYDFCNEKEFSEKIFLWKDGFSVGEGLNWHYWKYGLELSRVDQTKTNIGILPPRGIKEYLNWFPMTTKVFYISASPRTRLIRQMDRELNPDYSEICRRFLSDEKDFLKLREFSFTKIRNDNFPKDQGLDLIFEAIDNWRIG